MRLSLVAGLGGCSGTDVVPAGAPPAATDNEGLAQAFSDLVETCPPPRPALATLPAGGRDEIFVEAAIVDAPAARAEVSLSDLPELARSPQARLVASPHLLGKFGAETSLGLGQTADALAPVALSRWSMSPRHVDHETSVLELELELSELERPGRPPRSTLHRFSVTTRDNEPRLARLPRHGESGRSLVIVLRSFRVDGEAELRGIFECKMQHRLRYVQRRSAPATRTER